MEREQEDNVRHELDQEFDSLRDLIYAPDPSSTGSNSVPLGRNRPDAIQQSSISALAAEPQDVDYDQHVRELAFDKRAKPKDRTKTEEELALEEKDALEKAERRRRKRMLGLDDSDSENEEIKSRVKRKRGADDLEDDFYDEEAEWNGLGAGLADNSKGDNDEVESSTSEDEDEDSGEDEEDGSHAEAEDESGDSEGEAGDHEDLITRGQDGKGRSKSQNASTKELPYTFPCPSTHEEFLKIVHDLEDKDVPTVVQRIRTLYHTSLAPDNKFKLQACPLIPHVAILSDYAHPDADYSID